MEWFRVFVPRNIFVGSDDGFLVTIYVHRSQLTVHKSLSICSKTVSIEWMKVRIITSFKFFIMWTLNIKHLWNTKKDSVDPQNETRLKWSAHLLKCELQTEREITMWCPIDLFKTMYYLMFEGIFERPNRNPNTNFKWDTVRMLKKICVRNENENVMKMVTIEPKANR